MKIVIPGGSGATGRILARHFHRQGHEVVVLSRRMLTTPWRIVRWDGRRLAEWAREIDGADVVINLAGRTVDCRYTAKNRREILDSRVQSTAIVGEAIRTSAHPPPLWINASTATIYRHSLDREMDETTGEIGGGSQPGMKTWQFSIEVATAWERAFFEAPTPAATRKIATRTALTAIPHVSWLGKLTKLAHLGLGGAAGAGNQYVSWIHEVDYVRAIEFLIQREDIHGCVNLASSNPVTNMEFMAVLRAACGIKFGPAIPEWMLRMGAAMMGTEAELILKSRRVVPRRLLEAGFTFRFPTWPEAAVELLLDPRFQPNGAALPAGSR